MSKLNLFKPENFMRMGDDLESIPFHASRKANKILNDYIETLDKVWCRNQNGSTYWVDRDYEDDSEVIATARLICIEEIKPKECEHEPADVTCDIPRGSPLDHTVVFKWGVAKCKYCNKTLKPNWSVE